MSLSHSASVSSDLTDLANKIVGMAKSVFEFLGPGYTEVIYHNALKEELKEAQISFETEMIYNVKYSNGNSLGFIRCDLIVEKSLVVELKSITKMSFKESDREVNQLKRYLKDTGLTKGVLINFPISINSEDIVYCIL